MGPFRSPRVAPSVLAVCLLLSVGVRGQISQGTEGARKEMERGLAALAQKQPQEAQTAFRRAIAIDPLFYDAHSRFFNGLVYPDGYAKRQEGYLRARAVYQEWAATQPRNAVVHYFLGQTFIEDGDKADEYCLRAVKLAPDFAPPLETLARNADLRGESRRVSEYRKRVRAIRGTRQFAEQAYNAVGMPANRLIDAQGRIMFQPSLITDDDQRTVELEVEALIASRR